MQPLLITFAQGGQPGGNAPPPSLFGPFLVPLMLMGFVFYFLLIRPQSKEKKQRKAMLAAIKKNDRAVTVGGIVGTVLSVRDDEVTLKVDESNNTKITFTRSAIQRIIDGNGATAASGAARN